ncbi:hypothetical protein [Streptomyces sp. NPDC016845]|uniref:hypothetical protein n=1 Tax=Streptomyces sp. NPDC016845 TaxID=3364972 RepID=UPI00379F05F9
MRFIPECGIEDGERAEIEWVLSRIAVGEGPGRLVPPVHRVEVVRVITGGRSGAQVLEIRVQRGTPEFSEWHVAKLQEASAARSEWEAYKAYMAPLETPYRTSVSAVSATMLGSGESLPGDREVVVYQHVSQRIGEPGRPLLTLEQLAGQAVGGSGEALRSARAAVRRLLRQLGGTLYLAVAPDPRISLRWLNPTLGPDLLVEADDSGAPSERVYPADLLAASCAADEDARDPRLRAGKRIALDVSSISSADGVLLARPSPDTRVELRLAAGGQLPQAAADGKADGGRLLHATVVAARTERYARLCRELLGDALVLENSVARLDGCEFGHPFALLHSLLCDPVEGWFSASAHGDLNARNLLVADDQPYLIDHARADDRQPHMSDPAWLELDLLRNVVAPKLGWSELVRLQRALAVHCRLGRPTEDPLAVTGADEWPLAGESERFVAAFRLLWQVRATARGIYPDRGRRPWWREYLAQLTLAACRTLKWPAEAHDRFSAGAALVTAGVAGECLADRGSGQPGAFELWPAAELRPLAAWLLPQLDPARNEELGLLLDLIAALPSLAGRTAPPPATAPAGFLASADGRPTTPRDPLTAALEEARDKAIRALCGSAVERRLRTLRPGRSPYIDLRASTDGGTREGSALRLLADEQAAVLVGSAGAGKSTVLRELEYAYARAVTGESTRLGLAVRMPVLLSAADIAREWRPALRHDQLLARIGRGAAPEEAATYGDLLSLDGIHVLLDGLDEVSEQARTTVSRWLERLRADHPAVRLSVCHRTSAYHAAPAEILRLPTVVLHPVTRDQARHYTGGRLAGLLFDDEGADDTDGGAGAPSGLRRLMGTPLFLWMAVEAQTSLDPPPRTVGELFDAFTTWYLTERHHEAESDGDSNSNSRFRYGLEDKLPLLEAVGEHLTESGNLARGPLRRLAPHLGRVRPDWREVLDEVIASEFLTEEHGEVGFFHELFRSYFAARALARSAVTDPDRPLRRILRFDWQEAVRMLVGLPTEDLSGLTRLLETAASADPRYGAWLLRHCLAPPTELTRVFVARQKETLEAATAGRTAWQRAATALAVLRREPAWSTLAAVAAGPGHPPGARLSSLRAMADQLSRDTASARRDGDRGSAALDALRRTVDAVLGAPQPAPTPVETAALRAIGRARLMSLSGFAGERVRSDAPWPVVREACAALDSMDIALTPRQHKHRETACVRRLREADAEAERTSVTAESAALVRERAELLALLGQSRDPMVLDLLLEHRFAPGLADLPNWSGLLHGPARARLAADPDDPAAALLLSEGEVRRKALRVFAEGDELSAVAAAHRVLSDPAGPPWDLLESVSTESSGHRLLAAATAMGGLGPAALPVARRLIQRITATARPDQLDVLAALVTAVGRHSRPTRVRLAHRTAQELRRHGVQEAVHGSWARTFYESEIDDDVLTQLLERGDDDGLEEALGHMGAIDFLLTASGRPEGLTLSAGARRRLLSRIPGDETGFGIGSVLIETPEDVVRRVLAVSYAALREASVFVQAVADSTAAASTPVRYVHSGRGVLEVAVSAHAVTAVGWFGRLAAESQDQRAMRAAQMWLQRLDTAGSHPSLERARLVGLGLLGVWRPLLLGLVPGDAVLHEAAANVVLDWLPAPYPTDTPTDHAGVAKWIGHRLAAGRVTDPEVREVLSTLVSALGQRLGSYVHDPTPSSPDVPAPGGHHER